MPRWRATWHGWWPSSPSSAPGRAAGRPVRGGVRLVLRCCGVACHALPTATAIGGRGARKARRFRLIPRDANVSQDNPIGRTSSNGCPVPGQWRRDYRDLPGGNFVAPARNVVSRPKRCRPAPRTAERGDAWMFFSTVLAPSLPIVPSALGWIRCSIDRLLDILRSIPNRWNGPPSDDLGLSTSAGTKAQVTERNRPMRKLVLQQLQ
jgi:hypothetical protein